MTRLVEAQVGGEELLSTSIDSAHLRMGAIEVMTQTFLLPPIVFSHGAATQAASADLGPLSPQMLPASV